jgi:hypothetical protein
VLDFPSPVVLALEEPIQWSLTPTVAVMMRFVLAGSSVISISYIDYVHSKLELQLRTAKFGY